MDENIVILKGHVSNDPKVTNNGNLSVRFTLACNRKTSGDTPPSADFIPCVAFAKTAEILESAIKEGNFKKGSPTFIRGSFKTGSYVSQSTNQTVYTYDCLINNIDIMGVKSSGASTQPSSQPANTQSPSQGNGFGQQSGFASQSVPATPSAPQPQNPPQTPQPSMDEFAAMSSGLPWG